MLAYVQGIGIVAPTTKEAKMRKVIYPTYDNPPTTDEERALIERLKARPMSPALAERIGHRAVHRRELRPGDPFHGRPASVVHGPRCRRRLVVLLFHDHPDGAPAEAGRTPSRSADARLCSVPIDGLLMNLHSSARVQRA